MADTDDARRDDTVPEADRLEQERPADPRVVAGRQWPVRAADGADEADQLDQVEDVPGDPDEDYPPDPT